jgi:hypothetical protein
MKLSCFIVPIHPPHFAFACNLLASRDRFLPDLDIFFVFSSLEHAREFRRIKCSLFRQIVCNEELFIFCQKQSKYKGIIVLKKFFGLDHVFRFFHYRYAGVIDAECEFTKAVDVDKLFQEFCGRKTFYSSMTSHKQTRTVNKQCGKFFPREVYCKLKKVSGNFTQHFWFNQIPIYEREPYLDFRKKFIVKPPLTTGPAICEYTLYGYFLLVYYDWSLDSVDRLVSTTKLPLLGSLSESAQGQKVALNVAKILHSFWSKERIVDESVFMVYHLDRFE